ncbi:MAG: IolC myo-catabolism protein [Actinobacteria bacterium RBG_16_67_10]|nr:MAG: IolC myo-catabolism protein [Actinobacteria bacterium RBG_16_67_10]
MKLGYDSRLFLLAFDHRGSFKSKMFGIKDETPQDTARLLAAKRVVWQGFTTAYDAGLPDGAGILVDEEMGADILREAAKLGIPFAMPVEKSGQDVFDFEFGESFAEHIEAFDPTFAKVLVRWNPDDAAEVKAEQAGRLKRLGDWLHSHDRLFLFELLVPASDRQRQLVGGDNHAYDTRIRPVVMLDTIAELRDAGIEPDIWKIEGVDDRTDCTLIAGLARAGGRDRVKCVVLGRGADDERVDHWLRIGAGVAGYEGFAIGRSIWWDAIAGWKDGTLDESAAAELIAANYRRFIDVYLGQLD